MVGLCSWLYGAVDMNPTKLLQPIPSSSGRIGRIDLRWFAAWLVLVAASASSGAPLYWDTVDDSSGLDGGAGTWSTSVANWNTSDTGASSPLSVWTNGSDAVFNSAGTYTVTAFSTPEAANITFMQGNVTTSNDIRLLTGGKLLLETGAGDTLLGSVRQGTSTIFENKSSNLLTITNLNRISGTTSFSFAGVGNITVSTLANTNSGTITKNDAGTLRINAFSNTTPTKFIVNGGVLWLNTSLVSGTNAPTSSAADNAVTLNGGTLRTSQNRIYGLGSSAPHGILLGAGGGTLEQDSGTTFTQAGLVSGCGTLTKTGLGTLILSNSTNSYLGLTTLSAGVLEYGTDNAISAGGVTVNGASAILELKTFNDSVGTVTLDGGGQIKATGAGVGQGILTSTGTFEMKSGTVSAKLAGSGALNKTTAGTATLSSANSYSGVTSISEGTLEATADGALGGTTAVNINGGTLLLKKSGGGASTIVNNSAAVTLNGGTLKTADALTEDLGTLTLSSTSTIDLNGLGTLKFAASSLASWTSGAVLHIYNWVQDSATVYFGTDDNGLGGSQPASGQILLYSGTGSGLLGTAELDTDGQLISPIPEPGTVAVVLLLGLFLAWRERGTLSVLVFRGRSTRSA
jgi:fibronectin-binding autotransporter adhesin